MAIPRKVHITHTCPHCSLTFTRSGHLTRHLRVHTGERPYKCTHSGCTNAYSRNENLRRHELSHTPTELPFQCQRSDCNKTFATRQRLERHITLHDRPTPYQCSFCEKSFAKKRVLGEHLAEEHEGKVPYVCKEECCESAFSSPSELRRHVIKKHTDKSYVCMDEECVELPPFTKFSDLQRHLRRDHRSTPSCQCVECGKLFNTTSGLSRHLKAHELPAYNRLDFRCTFVGCHAVYTSSSNLGTHVRSKHTAQNAFVCEICEQTFSLKSSLKRHVLKQHIPIESPDQLSRNSIHLTNPLSGPAARLSEDNALSATQASDSDHSIGDFAHNDHSIGGAECSNLMARGPGNRGVTVKGPDIEDISLDHSGCDGEGLSSATKRVRT